MKPSADKPAPTSYLECPEPYPADLSALNDGYKRVFDLTIILIGHIILSPIFLLLWTLIPLAIKMEDGGEIFFHQPRMGKNRQKFLIIKFRTMVEDAEKITGPILSPRDDPRITRVGRVLRWAHLDELPQVFNIIKGEMSLVGPRPEHFELEQKNLLKMPELSQRLRVLPGITGLAQTRGFYDSEVRDKVRYDNLYIKRMHPLLDLKLLLISPFIILSGGERKKD